MAFQGLFIRIPETNPGMPFRMKKASSEYSSPATLSFATLQLLTENTCFGEVTILMKMRICWSLRLVQEERNTCLNPKADPLCKQQEQVGIFVDP